jgi:hypothetical protein
MPIYRNYIINDSDHFIASEFVELQISIQHIASELSMESSANITDMVISFVKDHSINSQMVKESSELANRISSRALPIEVMEALFDASRENQLFRKHLEDYIRSCLDNFQLGK